MGNCILNKKIVITVLFFAMLLASFASCTAKESKNGPQMPQKSYTDKMDIESYLNYFVGYFHESYRRGDDISKSNLLYLSFLFCFSSKDKLDLVKVSEENSAIIIPKKELMRIAGNLVPYSGDFSEYHEIMENSSSDFYSSETDSYIVHYARGYWKEDNYCINSGEDGKIIKPKISETDTELTAVVETAHALLGEQSMEVRTMEYKFDKVVDGGFLFYRLSSIRELS